MKDNKELFLDDITDIEEEGLCVVSAVEKFDINKFNQIQTLAQILLDEDREDELLDLLK